MTVTPLVRVQAEDFDAGQEAQELTRNRKDVGALVSFVGLCRDEAGTLSALELEHYPGMAEAELTRIANQAIDRWPLTGLTVVHRFGKIPPGENIVLVIAASAHRRAAFEAADFLMDFLKTRAPFWKKEHLVSGEESTWVEAKSGDDDDAARWVNT
ncbi:MAG: molybdenum cofactor biosynthesis protein MoaE [Roseibium sp.]|uniref:molybdenum cofactor biosynthesis protein MoaE n=1 Tax=Roseibium sp. TaxID=1936156 RepID=UPI001B0C839B|nr:molybdenum cofactor biosynthesis protein MoaE [Roseibium sp.]MBO6894187.1 molybdenum cofactor biosynthesis protein MoaE [Roseibium sp.]MBO6928901.1 molybdenum cofactor biosynthesis protein MoaE [Roseibium sp.]